MPTAPAAIQRVEVGVKEEFSDEGGWLSEPTKEVGIRRGDRQARPIGSMLRLDVTDTVTHAARRRALRRNLPLLGQTPSRGQAGKNASVNAIDDET